MNNIPFQTDASGALVHLSGFLFVVLVLSVLWLVVEAIGYCFRSLERKKQQAAAAVLEENKEPATDPNQIPEQDLVVIAATVTMMLGAQHRLISVQNAGANWGREGRRQHVQSHTIR